MNPEIAALRQRVAALERKLRKFERFITLTPSTVRFPVHVETQGMIILQGSFLLSGDGSPNNVVTAPVGSLFCRRDGGSGTTLYVKESGTGSSGWSSVA